MPIVTVPQDYKKLFAEKLDFFKQHEKPEVVLLVADDPERIKIIIAWSNLEVSNIENLRPLESDSENGYWYWLWQNIRYSKVDFVDRIGISFSESALESKMRPLIGNRIIYPDGTINSFVQRYLREQVLKLFEAKQKQSSK